MTDSPSNVWSFLSLVVSLVVAPGVMWLLNRKQTATITANNANAAQEVKAELAVAKTELKQDAAVAQATLAAVHETAVNTERLANGDRAAKEARIKHLERQMRAKGIEPEDAP